MLFSAYRIDQFGDPEGFKNQLGAVLEQYPDDVILHVCDPRTGIQRRARFPPTISEMVEACNERVAELKRHERYATWGEYRERQRDQALLPPPRESRASYAELKARYGPNWGIADVDPVRTRGQQPGASETVTAADVVDHYRTHGLDFSRKDEA